MINFDGITAFFMAAGVTLLVLGYGIGKLFEIVISKL